MHFRTIFVIIYIFIVTTIYLILFLPDLIFRHMLYEFVAKIWSGGILFISGAKIKVEGLENFNPDSNYVITGNHLSLLDIPALMMVFPGRIRIVYKKELKIIPIFGWMLSLVHVGVDRKSMRKSNKSFQKASKKFKNGISIVIFPEGTRSISGEMGKFKRGAFIFSIQNDIDILPYATIGSREVLCPTTTKVHPGTIYIKFAKPIFVKGKGYALKDRDELLDKTKEIISQEYEYLRKKYRN